MTPTRRGGLVVLQRYAVDQTHPVSLGVQRRTPRVPGDVQHVLASYRGFEGLLWPHVPPTITVIDGLAAVEQLAVVRRYAADLSRSVRCEVLYCCRAADGVSCDPPPSGFARLGFDVGVCRGEDNCFSAIFHELLFGQHDELSEFVNRLNKNLLLPSLIEATEFLERRAALLVEGFDLETDEDEFEVVLVAEAVIKEVPAS